MEIYHNPNVRIFQMQMRSLEPWSGRGLPSLWTRQWRRDSQSDAAYWRLYWASAQGAEISFRGLQFGLAPERFIMLPPGVVISRRITRRRLDHFYVHFATALPYDRLPDRVFVFNAEESMLRKIKSVPSVKIGSNETLTENISLTLAVRGLIYTLLSQIPDDELLPLRISPRLAGNMAFIESHIRHSISNAEIARHLGASVNTMLRLYRGKLKMSPHEYLRQKRIEKACALLHDPQKSIEQIAEETGFCDRFHFSRTFNAAMGVTPHGYRNQL